MEDLESLPEEDQKRMANMIDRLQINDRYYRFLLPLSSFSASFVYLCANGFPVLVVYFVRFRFFGLERCSPPLCVRFHDLSDALRHEVDVYGMEVAKVKIFATSQKFLSALHCAAFSAIASEHFRIYVW